METFIIVYGGAWFITTVGLMIESALRGRFDRTATSMLLLGAAWPLVWFILFVALALWVADEMFERLKP